MTADYEISPTPPIEFFTIQLMPLREGGISASLRSTVFDETDFELLDQDIANVRIATLDELMALIRTHVPYGQKIKTAAKMEVVQASTMKQLNAPFRTAPHGSA